MDTNNNEQFSMEQIMDTIDASMKKIRTGDLLKGKVISVGEHEVMVNIGHISDGIISKEELSNEGEINPKELLKEEQDILVYVLKSDDGEGNVLLSLKRAEAVKVWDDITKWMNTEETIDVKVIEEVKGGVIALFKGIRGFIPGSQLSIHHVDSMKDYVGRIIEVKIIEVDKYKEKLVLSRKQVEKQDLEAKRDVLWNSINKGEKRRGVVTKLANFGAFVDLDGVEGLIHISELAWRKVKDPAEVVSIGQPIEVYVLDVDKDKRRISLSLKELGENPWDNIEDNFKENTVMNGIVTRVLDFGAFVELKEGVEGLVHVSQISEENVQRPSSVLSVGEEVKVKILSVDKSTHRISLSIKDAVEKPVEDFSQYLNEEEDITTMGDLLRDKLKGLKLE